MRAKAILLLLALCANIAWAVKMHPDKRAIMQSDGTTLHIKGFGDHDFSYITTADGVLLYQDGTVFYIAEVCTDGTLASTGILAHDPQQRTAAETAAIEAQDTGLFASKLPENTQKGRLRREPMAQSPTLLPHTGSPRVPVILVEFSDTPFTVDAPEETFHKYLNATQLFTTADDAEMGMNYGSVKRYFTDMSFGKFSPDFDVYGPVKLSKPLKHYGSGNSAYENMDDLFADACTAVDAEADFSQYDSNNDGYVDLVYIIYAGYSQSIAGNSTDCIHPKSGTIAADITVDGKRLLRYGVNNELNGTPADQEAYGLLINGIGLFCHEFSHCMGLPDMYPTPGSVAERCINQNLDYWDLMDAGEYTMEGYRPTEYTAWERERFGWLAIDTLSTPQDVTLSPLSAGGKAYRIINDHDNTGREYYIVENVQNKGWNEYLFGHGMLVFHVDYDDYQFSLGGCKVNSTPGHPRMSVVAADGLFMPEYFAYTTITESGSEQERLINLPLTDKYGGIYITADIYTDELAGDPFPGIALKTELTDSSTPAAAVYTGNFINKPITEIKEHPETGTITFKFMGGNDATGIKSLPQGKYKPKIYYIDGRCAGTDPGALEKGIYIINRKKVVL